MTHKGWCVVKQQTNKQYNNVAKGIRLLDKKAFFVYTGKNHASKRFWKIYPLKGTI